MTAKALHDDLSEVMFGLASVMVGQQVTLTARQFLQLALMARPNDPFTLFTLGMLDDGDKAYDKALTYYRKVPKGSMPYLAAQVRIAEVLFARGQQTAGLKELSELVAARPDLPLVHRSLAQMYFDQKDYADAIKAYTSLIKGIDGPPVRRHASLFFARGAAYERLGDEAKSIADLQQALKLDPDNAVVLNYLAYMWVEKGEKLDQAYDYIKRALKLRPDDGAIVDSLGWLFYQQGRYDLAAKYLEKAVSMLPEDSTINAHLGDTYAKLSRLGEARTQWQRALDLGPESAADATALKEKLGILQKPAKDLHVPH